MTKKLILTFLTLSPLLITINAQNHIEYKTLTINEIVGDTIDRAEKNHYGLYPQYSHLNFAFAQYLMKDGEFILRIHFNDKSFYDQAYSYKLFLEDNDKIIENQNRKNTYTEPKTNYRRAIIILRDIKTGKSIRLRKGKAIELKIAGSNKNSRYARIRKIDFTADPALKLKYYGERETLIVPVSEIEYIYRMSVPDFIAIKTLAVIYSALGLTSLLVEPVNNPVAITFLAIGTTGFLVKNRRFYPSKSEIQIKYK